MSWTQGVLPREEMPEQEIERLEAAYERETGETDRVEYITWFEIDGSDAIVHFEGGRGFRLVSGLQVVIPLKGKLAKCRVNATHTQVPLPRPNTGKG